MNAQDVKDLLEKQLLDCEIRVEVDGSHVNIIAVGNIFEGKRTVQRQQVVYAALQEQIASGVIHAVNMKTFTNEEWQQIA
jgi:acid stress-induced BolA-like protein IbaG/YrbA